MQNELAARRGLEVLGITMMGEGALVLVDPAGHLGLWRGIRPQLFDRCVHYFLERPKLTRLVGAIELATGLALAMHQFAPASPKRECEQSGTEGDQASSEPAMQPQTF